MGFRVAVEGGTYGGYSTKWLDVEDLADLRRQLAHMGVSKVARYQRDLMGNASGDGEAIPVDALTMSDLEWASEKDPKHARYLSVLRQLDE